MEGHKKGFGAMKLALGTRKIKTTKDGVSRIGAKELVILDPDTGSELDDRVAMLWGDKSLLTTGEPLLTDEYFTGDPEASSYLIVIVRCDSAIDLDS